MYGHNYHFHVRMFCPKGDTTCEDQDAVPAGDLALSAVQWTALDAYVTEMIRKGVED